MSEMNIPSFKPSLAMKAAIIALKANKAVTFWGPAGVGKSDMVRQIAAILKMPTVWEGVTMCKIVQMCT